MLIVRSMLNDVMNNTDELPADELARVRESDRKINDAYDILP